MAELNLQSGEVALILKDLESGQTMTSLSETVIPCNLSSQGGTEVDITDKWVGGLRRGATVCARVGQPCTRHQM